MIISSAQINTLNQEHSKSQAGPPCPKKNFLSSLLIKKKTNVCTCAVNTCVYTCVCKHMHLYIKRSEEEAGYPFLGFATWLP